MKRDINQKSFCTTHVTAPALKNESPPFIVQNCQDCGALNNPRDPFVTFPFHWCHKFSTSTLAVIQLCPLHFPGHLQSRQKRKKSNQNQKTFWVVSFNLVLVFFNKSNERWRRKAAVNSSHQLPLLLCSAPFPLFFLGDSYFTLLSSSSSSPPRGWLTRISFRSMSSSLPPVVAHSRWTPFTIIVISCITI